ncbi:MAG: hybrid sensor histidine kinase/response regulator [Candidatus Tectimicrobiota bacterium]|nr:MAG: hybrid sensor histidine kinase/response regulator [Candidatus Tectomicrobia bacterium]
MASPLHVLLVDDNPDDRLLVARELQREFAELQVTQVFQAEDFAQALARGGIDLVITDYQLRWSDGLAVLRAVKARWPDCPVIMFTATGSEEVAVAAMKAGLDDYVLKSPKHYVRLPAAVRAALERAATRRRAQALESRLNDLLERLHIGVFRATPAGQLLEANTALRRLLGLPDEAAVTRHTLPELLGQPLRPEPEQELQVRRADGRVVWLALSTALTAAAEGEPLLEGLVEDITARKNMEQALRQSEARYRTLFEDSHDAVYIVSRDGRLLAANRATQALLGYSWEELQQLNARDLYADPTARQRFQQEIERTGAVKDYAVQFRRKDGAVRDCLLTATVWRDAQGQVGGYQGIIRDITEQKRLEAQVRQLQKMEALGTLAGGIAHDFNNILAAILGYTELALADAGHSEALRRHLQEVLAACRRARDLVKQILTFSRQQEQVRQLVSLPAVVKEALAFLRATLPTTIAIEQALDETLGPVLADATQLQQMLLNLGANAAHAMREGGGVLTVRLEGFDVDAAFAATHPPLRPGPHARLVVRDTGHGIPPAIRERIFEPFFTTKGPGEGTGMGLAVVHGIVTQYGGAIEVESTPGQGTMFTIYLPLAEPLPVAPRPAAAAPLQRGHEHILLVEDEAVLAQLGQELLTRLGYRVTVRTSSLEALEAFRANPQRFDLVLTDQTMPNLTGDRLAQELRRLRPDIPIVLCTGFSAMLTEARARELGIDALLLKPLTAEELSRTLRRVLDASRRAPQGMA